MISFLLFFPLLASADVCQTVNDSGVPRIKCTLPACPEGKDCQGPTLDRKSASVEPLAPKLAWKSPCPDLKIRQACWEVSQEFRIKVSAFDPSGVHFIGVQLATEDRNERTFKKIGGRVESGQEFGRAQATVARLSYHAEAGSIRELVPTEFCAVDAAGNESCVLPEKP